MMKTMDPLPPARPLLGVEPAIPECALMGIEPVTLVRGPRLCPLLSGLVDTCMSSEATPS